MKDTIIREGKIEKAYRIFSVGFICLMVLYSNIRFAKKDRYAFIEGIHLCCGFCRKDLIQKRKKETIEVEEKFVS